MLKGFKKPCKNCKNVSTHSNNQNKVKTQGKGKCIKTSLFALEIFWDKFTWLCKLLLNRVFFFFMWVLILAMWIINLLSLCKMFVTKVGYRLESVSLFFFTYCTLAMFFFNMHYTCTYLTAYDNKQKSYHFV